MTVLIEKEENQIQQEDEDFQKWKENFYKEQKEKNSLIESGDRKAIEESRKTEREIMARVKEKDPALYEEFINKDKKQNQLMLLHYYLLLVVLFANFMAVLMNLCCNKTALFTIIILFICLIANSILFNRFKKVMNYKFDFKNYLFPQLGKDYYTVQ